MTPDTLTTKAVQGLTGSGEGRRGRLREFQSQLVERMQAARTGADTHVNQLGLLIGSQRWLLPLQQAGEIVSVGTITPVPLTQDWFLGVTNIRGNLVTVVDYARFCGESPSVVDKDSRIIAFAPALSFNAGLLVSRVLGLRNMAQMQEHAGEGAQQPPGHIDQDGHIWRQLDLAAAAVDPRFLQIGI